MFSVQKCGLPFSQTVLSTHTHTHTHTHTLLVTYPLTCNIFCYIMMRLTAQKANPILSSSVCLQQGLEVLVILDHRSCVTCIVMMTPMWVML